MLSFVPVLLCGFLLSRDDAGPRSPPSPPPSLPDRVWVRTPATGDLLVLPLEEFTPADPLDLDVDTPPRWELWKKSGWLCTEAGGDWKAFMYAQGISWLLVEAMAATGHGVGSEMHLHMKTPREMHGEAFFSGLSVPGVDTHQWQHYYYDWQPFVAQIPLADDQAWRGTWLGDGSQWVVMSGRSGAWQYRAHQGLSDDGMVFWSRATILPQNVSVSRTFRRLGNMTADQVGALQSLQSDSLYKTAALLLCALLVVGGLCHNAAKVAPLLPTMN